MTCSPSLPCCPRLCHLSNCKFMNIPLLSRDNLRINSKMPRCRDRGSLLLPTELGRGRGRGRGSGRGSGRAARRSATKRRTLSGELGALRALCLRLLLLSLDPCIESPSLLTLRLLSPARLHRPLSACRAIVVVLASIVVAVVDFITCDDSCCAAHQPTRIL